VFASIVAKVPSSAVTQLLRPVVKIDLGEAARVGFLPVVQANDEIARELPKETLGNRGRVDERALVYVIGRALRGLIASLDGEYLALQRVIIERCIEEKPAKRYRTLQDLESAWTYAAAEKVTWGESESLESWQLAEEATGWLAFGNRSEATWRFERAWGMDPKSPLANEGLRHVGLSIPAFHSPWDPPPPLAWTDVVEQGARLEAERAFKGALGLYADVRLDGKNDLAVYLAIARCQLALGVPGIALDYAGRALAVDSTNVDALSIRTRACLLDRKPEDALNCADIWIAEHSLDASARYARGRALFALGRFEEAREAFERACLLDPRMVEAMLLRREADRAMRRVRETVGTQPEIDLELPEHLSELRDAFAAGRIEGMLRVIERPEYDNDAVAKLLHAQCLAFEKRYADAVLMFDRVAQLSTEHEPAAILGKAQALLALNRADEALALFDRACAAAPSDLEAIEGRALALRKLGREAEADDELQRVVAASGGRSDLRVGQASRSSRA
jgi:tetratricopeptide (TPR) repeat protein